MVQTIGNQLKKARETGNFTLDQAANATHIRPSILTALEEDRFDEIPSTAQTKGFIRLYADWLNISSDPLIMAFEGKQIPPIEEIIPSNYSNSIERENIESIVEKDPVQIEGEGFIFDQNKVELSIDSDLTQENSKTNIEEQVQPISQHGSDEDTSLYLFNSIGLELRNCREKLGIPIEEIEKHTKIRARNIVALENGQFDEIPSMVQARGLLQGYSAFLNLDTDHLMGVFADALQKRRLELLPPEPLNKKSKQKSASSPSERHGFRRFLTVDMMVGTVAILGLVGFGVWGAAQILTTDDQRSIAAPPPISDVLLSNPTIVPVTEGTTTAQPTELARNPDLIGQIPNADSPEVDTSQNEEPTSLVPNLGDSSMQVYIVPNQRVFLQVSVGNKVVFTGRTIPGNAYPFTSEDRIDVVCANAAAIQIYYNQRDLGTLGLPGETLRLIFTRDGIATPTPSNTQLPTNTLLPTLTLMPTATPVPPTITPLIP
jgi:cytoskeletal protein RodZ